MGLVTVGEGGPSGLPNDFDVEGLFLGGLVAGPGEGHVVKDLDVGLLVFLGRAGQKEKEIL